MKVYLLFLNVCRNYRDIKVLFYLRWSSFLSFYWKGGESFDWRSFKGNYWEASLKYVIEGQFINITHKNPQNVISEVKGKIIAEEDGLPVIGATIQVEGTSIRTITDANGNFRLVNVPQSNRIKISYVACNLNRYLRNPRCRMVLKPIPKHWMKW